MNIFKHRHKWKYHQFGSPLKYLRSCRCGIVEEYKDIPVYGKGWYQLVSFTKKGGEDLLNELNNAVGAK